MKKIESENISHEKILLAVVIPYYNLSFFDQTLKSLQAQTNRKFNVYIGNDFSTEDPFEIIQQNKGGVNITYKKFKTNLGRKSLAEQFNRCIDLIGNEQWVMVLGDDDLLDKDCVDDFYKSIEQINGANKRVIRFATQVIDESGRAISDKYFNPEAETSIHSLFRKLNGEARSSLSEFVFKAEILKFYRFKNFPLAWHSDDLAVMEVSEFGLIHSINSSAVKIRISGSNISSKTNNTVIKNKASFYFYRYLLKTNKRFSALEKKVFYKKLTAITVNNKRTLSYPFLVFSAMSGNLRGGLGFILYLLKGILKG